MAAYLGKLVSPNGRVGLVLGDPVLVHVVEQVDTTELKNEFINRSTVPSRDKSAVGELLGGRLRVVLAGEIAVLFIRAITVVRPETVDGPATLGELLALKEYSEHIDSH
jgi:hypothetical protein